MQSAYHVLALGRFQIVSWVLGMGFHVIFTDTDVVTIKDPVSMLLEVPPPPLKALTTYLNLDAHDLVPQTPTSYVMRVDSVLVLFLSRC